MKANIKRNRRLLGAGRQKVPEAQLRTPDKGRIAQYAGWPNAFSALPVVKEVFEKRRNNQRVGERPQRLPVQKLPKHKHN
jgi:hypothetical protein